MRKVVTIEVYPGKPPAHPEDLITADPILTIQQYEQNGVTLRSITKK